MSGFSVRRLYRPVTMLAMIAVFCALEAGETRAQEAGSRPNILFAIADDWSFGHASAYGSKWVKTPGFDRVAREGILFTRAYTPNAKCAPSRACILTGRNSWQLKEAANHFPFFPPEFKTYAEAIGEHGYFVGSTGKTWSPGVANDEAGQRRNMAGLRFNRVKAPPPARRISNNDYAGNFKAFLDAAPKSGPWCFWYGATEPHRGYEYGVGVAKAGKKLSDIEKVPGFWPDNEIVRNDILDYAFEVEHFDRHLLRMIALLEQRDLLDRTLIVATSDHGMPFPRAKGQAYDESNHVPLAIRWKSGIRRPGRVVDDYVSFIDIVPTFLEVTGIEWKDTGMARLSGRSLVEIFSSERSGQVIPERDHVLIGKERHDIGRPNDWGYPIRGIVKGDVLYIRNYEPSRWPACNPETGYLNCDGSPTKTEVLKTRLDPATKRFWDLCFGRKPGEELYDLKKDRACLTNLSGHAEMQALKARLADQLTRELKAQNDPRMSGQGDVFDRYMYSSPATRNFYERFMRGEKVRAGWANDSDFEKAPLD